MKLILISIITIYDVQASQLLTDKKRFCNQATSCIKVSRLAYQDKLHGFWLGQSIANWTGLITEMDKVGTPATMPFYTDNDWGRKDLPAMWGQGVPHSDIIDFFFVFNKTPWGSDDDTDIEYMYQYLHEYHQTTLLTAKQIQQGWLTHTYSETDAPLFTKFPDDKPVKENFLWESNQQARKLMAKGFLPPATSEPVNNDKYMMIDAQLTTEIFGLLSPAREDVALKMAELPIRTSANYDAYWISQFYVVMHALASKVDKAFNLKQQVLWMADQARNILPERSTSAYMYDFIKKSYLNNPDKDDWEKTRDEVYRRYQVNHADGYVYKDPFEAGINFAASLVSLFYGEGDIVRTIQIGTLAGWDSDNPTATWGGLLGFMIGQKGVSKAFKQNNLSEHYWIHRTRRNFPDHTANQSGEDSFSAMAKRAIQLIDLVVVEKMHGHVDLTNNVWHIPNS
ncbi:MAG: ADP-ribosylglycohydrolase family protein [Litorilituus sp.]|nr:ADP-ribosylglycohydrolase family protein [Litorilituus sp.]